VGIVRVERELARRAREHMGDGGGFCLFVPRENGIRLLPDDAAQEILAGRLQIDFAASRAELAAVAPTSLRRQLREAILRHPRLYQWVQKLRGLSFSLEQIEDVRRSETLARLDTTAVGPKLRSVDEVAPDRLPLDKNTLIISGGLDWEYKDIRGLYRMKAKHEFQYAVIVYDLIPVIYPHYVVPSYVTLLRDYFGELFWLADYCMSISACTQKDMLAYCADFGVPAPAAEYFPLGGDIPHLEDVDPAELPGALLGKKYAIFVSTIEPRKNHRTLYEAWDRAIRQGLLDAETCRLVFVGMGGWNTGDLRSEMAANPLTRETIVTLSGISDAQLRLLYQHADFSLFPSFYEGYGLPVAEALSYGLPCICSNAGSLPEIAGDLIRYCDPWDSRAWMEAIVEAFNRPEDLQRHADRISATFKAPTWDQSAEQFFSKLDRLVAEKIL
jgi:glycosyltransferase involved in cell wall biosynthesis